MTISPLSADVALVDHDVVAVLDVVVDHGLAADPQHVVTAVAAERSRRAPRCVSLCDSASMGEPAATRPSSGSSTARWKTSDGRISMARLSLYERLM